MIDAVAPRPDRGQTSQARSLFHEFLQTAGLATLIFLILQTVFQPYRVEQSSMEPTLHEGQYLFVSRIAYLDFRRLSLEKILIAPASAAEETDTTRLATVNPHRGDLVVLEHPRQLSQHLIKRVVAVAGDTISVRDQHVYVNRNPLTEDYVMDEPIYTMQTRLVGPNQVFVLGDNRNNSYDSHIFGAVDQARIVGKAYPVPFISLRPISEVIEAVLAGL